MKHQPFYFVRHGQTDWNVRQLCQGQTDIPLNDDGRGEADRAGRLLVGTKVATIAFSPLLRASETAEIIARYLPGVPLVSMESLKERAWGAWEGVSSEQMYSQEELEREGKSHDIPADGFETKASFLTRIRGALDEVLELQAPAVLVSHGRFFNALCEVLGAEPVKQLENGVPVYCSPEGREWKFRKIEIERSAATELRELSP